MPQRPLTCALTGPAGYIGSVLAAALSAANHAVVPLSRDPARLAGARRFSLAEPIAPGTFANVDALVHCAWDFAAASAADVRRINVDGSLKLLDAARAAGVRRTVFISSMSAFDGCRSIYGKAKLDVERRASDVVAVRPGLVHGPRPGGMVAALAKLTALPLIPLPGAGGQPLYLTHQDDLAQLVLTLLAATDRPPAPLIAAHDQPLAFRQILRRLAAAHGRRPLLCPFPWQLQWLALRSAELVGLRPRLRADSLISLLHQDPHPDFAAARAVGVTFRPFDPVAV